MVNQRRFSYFTSTLDFDVVLKQVLACNIIINKSINIQYSTLEFSLCKLLPRL